MQKIGATGDRKSAVATPDGKQPKEELKKVEWLRAWDTLTMFEATVCGRS